MLFSNIYKQCYNFNFLEISRWNSKYRLVHAKKPTGIRIFYRYSTTLTENPFPRLFSVLSRSPGELLSLSVRILNRSFLVKLNKNSKKVKYPLVKQSACRNLPRNESTAICGCLIMADSQRRR